GGGYTPTQMSRAGTPMVVQRGSNGVGSTRRPRGPICPSSLQQPGPSVHGHDSDGQLRPWQVSGYRPDAHFGVPSAQSRCTNTPPAGQQLICSSPAAVCTAQQGSSSGGTPQVVGRVLALHV